VSHIAKCIKTSPPAKKVANNVSS